MIKKTIKKTFKLFEIASRINPDNPDTCYRWAVSLYEIGKIKRSVKMLLHTMRVRPNYYNAYRKLQRTFYEHYQSYYKVISQINICLELISHDADISIIKSQSKILLQMMKSVDLKLQDTDSKSKDDNLKLK